MRQSFDETTDPSFGPRHAPLIRQAMAAQGLDGFLIPHEDEHQNEYLPAANDRLAWATGFTGSAGAAVILKDKAAVFVDGRYTIQVRDQVDPATFEIRDFVDGGVPAYLREALRPGMKVGYDARLHSPDALHWLGEAAAAAGASLVPVNDNPLDRAWGAERPGQPKAEVVPHPLDYAGEDSAAKRARVGEAVAKAGGDAAVLTAPASIAWLFNIRGGDVIRSPLPLAQAILDASGEARLFLDPEKVSDELPAWLGNSVRLERPEDLEPALASLKGRKVLVDPSHHLGLVHLQPGAGRRHRGARRRSLRPAPRLQERDRDRGGPEGSSPRWRGPVALPALGGDARPAPLCRTKAPSPPSWKASARRPAPCATSPSTPSPRRGRTARSATTTRPPAPSARVTDNSLLLVDSGAQYLDGTTDVTRTVAIGVPTQEMRERFTLVLKGHLALARVRFPEGTTGPALDALARVPLWSAGLDYDHGTGHGVGSYLGVHEGPQRIAKVQNTVALRPGMIVSNEPGYYKEGEYGIRIENLQVVTQPTAIPGGERKMLGFETLTLAPIDRELVETALLTAEERAQFDAYHARVLAEIGPQVPAEVRAWLEAVCAPL